jgi:signal transduction histidine kinase
MVNIARIWIVKLRNAKPSTWVIGLFIVAVVLPWPVYAWLAVTDRAREIDRAEHNLTMLAAAYGEHAALVNRLASTDAVPGTASNSDRDSLMTERASEMASFRRALDAPGVELFLREIGTSGDSGNAPTGAQTPRLPTRVADTHGLITVEVDHAMDGIASIAALSEDGALNDWRQRTLFGVVGLLLRTLFVIAAGAFLVHQLRWREELQTKLATARQVAERSSRAKSAFLANMSHELRTPLNAIIGFSEVIKGQLFGPVGLRYQNYAVDIHDSGTHLLELINEILDLSKLEAGQVELYEQTVNLASVLDACIKLIETPARDAKIRLSASLDGEALIIRADDRRLRQILINLLSNAVKFTPEGGAVRVRSFRTQNGFVIAVSDTGVGMNASDIPKIMKPFGQIDDQLNRQNQGTGLGLPIAKHLVELHGGTLNIESEVNVGTTVTITLPSERLVRSSTSLAAA